MEQSSNVSLIYFILFESMPHSQETNVSRQKSYTSCERVVMVIGAASNKAWKKKCIWHMSTKIGKKNNYYKVQYLIIYFISQ